MTDIRIDRPEEPKTQTKKYYKSKYCFSLQLPKDLEEKVKDAAESEARNVTSYITSLILKDLKEKELLNIPWWRSHPIHENRATESIWTQPCNPLLRATKSTKRATSA